MRKLTRLCFSAVLIGLLAGCGDGGTYADEQPDPGKLQALQQDFQNLLARMPSDAEDEADPGSVERALSEAQLRLRGEVAAYDNAIAIARIELNGMRLRLARVEREAAVAQASAKASQTEAEQQAAKLAARTQAQLDAATRNAQTDTQSKLSQRLDATLQGEPGSSGSVQAGPTVEIGRAHV